MQEGVMNDRKDDVMWKEVMNDMERHGSLRSQDCPVAELPGAWELGHVTTVCNIWPLCSTIIDCLKDIMDKLLRKPCNTYVASPL